MVVLAVGEFGFGLVLIVGLEAMAIGTEEDLGEDLVVKGDLGLVGGEFALFDDESLVAKLIVED